MKIQKARALCEFRFMWVKGYHDSGKPDQLVCGGCGYEDTFFATMAQHLGVSIVEVKNRYDEIEPIWHSES